MNTVTTKTSELIRNAVDAHLSDGVATMEANTSGKYTNPYICLVLAVYSNGSPQARMVENLIQEELRQYRKEHPVVGLNEARNISIGGTLNWQWHGEELQAFRFMYAEMLACYFESIGD